MGRVLESGLLAQLIACVTNYRDAGRAGTPSFPPFHELDNFLKPLGCPVSLRRLCGSGCPLPIPYEPFPAIGCWSPDEVVAAKEFFDQLPSDRASGALAFGVSEVRDWLNAAIHRESGATRLLQASVERNPDQDMFQRLLRRRKAEESRPAALIGFLFD
jgi:hypothetical protein